MLSIFVLSLVTLFSHAESSEGPCSLELGFGLQGIKVTNPDSTIASSHGYGGFLTGRYAFVATEKFHIAARVSVGYGDLKNEANTEVLSESTTHLTAGPGLELRVYHFVLGGDYQYNNTSIEETGNLQSSVSSTFYAPQLFLGIDIPLGVWGLRFYYMRSATDLPKLDTGLSEDSPWTKEQFMLALRFNPRHTSSSALPTYTKFEGSSSSSESSSSGTDSTSAARPIRYYPRPSRNLGN